MKFTTEEYLSEQDYPKLRDFLSDLATDFGIDGISWFNEDNTGEIQIATAAHRDIGFFIENGDITEPEIINLNEFLKEQYNEENYFISYK